MRRTALLCAFAVLLCAVPPAFAQGGAALCKSPVKLAHTQRVSSLTLAKGSYQVTVAGDGRPHLRPGARPAARDPRRARGKLPDGWQVELSTPDFARADGSDAFRISRAPAAGGGGGGGLSWSEIQDWMVIWLPIIFMGMLAFAILWLLRLTPRTKPQEIKPSAAGAVRWADVAGVEESKDELREVVEFLRDPKRFRKLGARVPQGHPAARAAGHGQDAARQGRRARVERDLLRPVGVLVRRDVRRASAPPASGGCSARRARRARRSSSSTSSTPWARRAARTSRARRTRRSTSCWSSSTASPTATSSW